MTVGGLFERYRPSVGSDELRRRIAGREASDFTHRDAGGARPGAETFHLGGRHRGEDLIVVAAGERVLEQYRIGFDERPRGARERHRLSRDPYANPRNRPHDALFLHSGAL